MAADGICVVRAVAAGASSVTGTSSDFSAATLDAVDILYGMEAAGNRKFGLRVGARFVGYGLHLVAVLGFTTD